MTKRTFQNPILPGFYPDPSICRVGEDYYLITSTFEYFPGLPIFHSRDLVSWQQIGHVLDRPSQLPLDGITPSRGLYAPTIRHHDGVFYVINTLVENDDTQDLGRQGDGCRNFIVTATDPAGPWSEPYWLDDVVGIDPSLFFDDDGTAWYTGNRMPEDGEGYPGDREIWLQQLDLEMMQLTGQSKTLWGGAVEGNLHAEAPHLFKKDGYYYLLIAEGGTGHTHAVTIARSKHISGPYETGHINPILTHRHLGQDFPIVGTGHSDLVETQHGDWWLVLLAMRPYDGYYYNLGRETFLVKVIWEDEWPIVAPGIGHVRMEEDAPNLPHHPFSSPNKTDHFDNACLEYQWNFLRTPRDNFWSLADNPGHLRLKLRPESIVEKVNPSFVGRRQQHINFHIETQMNFIPQAQHETAGLVLLQNNDFQFRFVITLNEKGDRVVRLIKRENGIEMILEEEAVNGTAFKLIVTAVGQSYSFAIEDETKEHTLIAADVDGRILSTPVAGGFVGAYIGMYASSNGERSGNHADFDYFTYSQGVNCDNINI